MTTAPTMSATAATAQINQRLKRLEAHVRQLAAAAAESQLAGQMRSKRHKRGWADVYDGLANTLAQPGLDELQHLRSMLGPSASPSPANQTASTGMANTGMASTGMASTGMASTGMASTGASSTPIHRDQRR